MRSASHEWADGDFAYIEEQHHHCMHPEEIILRIKDGRLPARSVIIDRNEFLKTGGTIDTNIYFIEEGSVRIFIADGEEERIIRFGYANNIIVPLDSFLSEKPSEFYIQAIKRTSIRIVTKQTFLQFIDENTEHVKAWIAILEDLVLQQIEREKDLLTHSPKERYERVLKRSPQLFQQIPHKYIANYLRMTPETLSRLKKS